MHRFFKQLLNVLVITLTPLLVRADNLSDIDTIVNDAMATFEVPGAAIGIVQDGKIIYAKGFGYRDLKGKQPVTTDTLFAIGSCTKAFTTLVLGTLVDEGLIHWDDPVIRYLPEFRLKDDYATHKTTIRDLTTHCTGLPGHNFAWYNSDLTRDEVLKRLEHLDFTHDLRKKFQYNNVLYAVLGLVIERVTGNSWEEEVQARIFSPLGMVHSNFSIEAIKNSHNFSYPHAKRKNQMQIIPFQKVVNMGPAGSINSNIEEMVHWIKLQLSEGVVDGKTLIQQSTLDEMRTIQVAAGEFPKGRSYLLGYGLGWYIGNYGGHYLVGHGGAVDGFISSIFLLPQENIGVIVLTNTSSCGENFVQCVNKSIFDRVLNLKPHDWVKKLSDEEKEAQQAKNNAGKDNTSPSHTLEDYIGEYEHPGYGTLTISLINETLVVSYNQILTQLEHKHYDVFIGSHESHDPALADMHFSFRTCHNGDISEVQIPFELHSIVFTKKAPPELHDISYLKTFEGQYISNIVTAKVILRGKELIVLIPGQPDYTLIPESDAVFAIEGLSGYSVKFVKDEHGKVVELQSIQPYGVYTLTRETVKSLSVD
jgi:CubicO group peptidase (beta-lactamase class C family)